MDPETKKPWYYLNAKEAIMLTTNCIRDFSWSILTFYKCNYALQPEETLLAQSLGEELWSSVIVIGASPLTAYTWMKFYGDSWLNCLIYCAIADISALAAIIPWNYFAYLGKEFFITRGFSEETANYLSVIFPGPGMAEGTIQTLVTAFLSYFWDKTFIFNLGELMVELTPLAYIPGDTWLAAYLAVSDLASKQTGGVIAQALAVMAATCVMNYLAEKATVNLGDKLWTKLKPCLNTLGFFKDPPRRSSQVSIEEIMPPLATL